MSKTEVDVTPHPKVLTVLGEIEFKPIQCIAELIDNSIDGFLNMERAGTPIYNPSVHVAFGRDTVIVKDDGPGMSIDDLEMAVKAGWSSQEKFGNLGLYGIGFNIATARLGTFTEIWTTQTGDDQWYGLKIDLQEIARAEVYKLQVHTRSKSDSRQSGTIVEVSHIKSSWKGSFDNQNWIRSNITDKLANMYSTMLRDVNPQPIKFTLLMNNKKVSAWEHCVWPEDWVVYRKDDTFISPIQQFDHCFGTKFMSISTGMIYDKSDNLDKNDIIEVPERVYGWIGIQRYGDDKEYGIDILRNGRKIEIFCKDIFYWEDPEGNLIHEYIIDDPSQRGRIVGEVHLDHGYVHYTKDRFEREHSSWKQLLQMIRNNEPLTKRAHYNYTEVNTSPLGVLFRTFRRNSPLKGGSLKYKDLLFIKENDKAKQMAREYRKGATKYRDLQIWKEELDKSDESSLPPPIPSPSSPNNGNQKNASYSNANGNGGKEKSPNFVLEQGNLNPNNETTAHSNNGGLEQPNLEKTAINKVNTQDKLRLPQRTLLNDFCLHITNIGVTSKSYDVEVYALEYGKNSNSNAAWQGRLTERNIYEIDVNLQHSTFNSTSLQVQDAVLAQVAHLITTEEIATIGPNSGVNYGDILVSLRTRYAKGDSLDPNQLRIEIDIIRKQILQKLSHSLDNKKQLEFINILPAGAPQRIQLAYARGSKKAAIINYLDVTNIVSLFKIKPEMFFLAGCFNKEWTPLTLESNTLLLDEHRKQLVHDLTLPFEELKEFVDSNLSLDLTRSYLGLVRACINRIKDYLAE